MSSATNKADEFHHHITESLDATVFFAQAEEFLEEYNRDVIEDVVPRLTEMEGRWHPLGFAVFPLTVREDGSSLRLHVWPKNMRRGHSLRQPAIHNHAWHLISRVLSRDPYQDTRHSIEVVSDVPSTEEKRISRGLQRVFRAHYPPEPQGLRTDGTCARVTPIRDVVVPTGRYNSIVAGEYHLDTVPIGHTVATLCLDSPKLVKDGPHVIVDGPADPIEVARPSIPSEDIRYIQDALLKSIY